MCYIERVISVIGVAYVNRAECLVLKARKRNGYRSTFSNGKYCWVFNSHTQPKQQYGMHGGCWRTAVETNRGQDQMGGGEASQTA